MIIALVQSQSTCDFCKTTAVTPGLGFILGAMAVLTTGAVVIMHSRERVTNDDGAMSSDNALGIDQLMACLRGPHSTPRNHSKILR